MPVSPGLLAPPTTSEAPPLARAAQRRRRLRQAVVPRWLLATLAVLEFVVVFASADRFFYYFDDVKWQAAAEHQPLGLRFFTQPVNDHFVPAWLAMQRFVPRLFDYHYWGLAAVIAGFVVLVSVLLWILGASMGVPHLLLLPAVALLGLNGVVSEEVSWWSAMLHALPSTAAVLGVWILFVQFQRGQRRYRPLAAAAVLFVGECFIEKVSVWVVLIPLFDLLVLQRGTPFRGRWRGLRDGLRFYLALVGAAVAYFFWWWVSTPFPQQEPFSVSRDLAFSWWSWFEGFWPMVLSLRTGNYAPGHLSGVMTAALALVQVVLVAGIVYWCVRVPRARPLVAWFAVGFVLNQLVLASGRGLNVFGGALAGRYQADSLVELAVVLFCALPNTFVADRAPALPDQAGSRRRRATARQLAVATAVAVAVGGFGFFHEMARQSNLRSSAVLQRRAFASLAALPAGSRVLDLPTTWDASAVGYTNPSEWRGIAHADQRLALTDVGRGTFDVLTPQGAVARTAGPAGRAADVCSYLGEPRAFVVDGRIPRPTAHSPSVVLWADVTAPRGTSVTLQVSARGTDVTGPLAPGTWFTPLMGPLQAFTLRRGGAERLWFQFNPRWYGEVLQARVVVLSGAKACVGQVGFGPVG